MASPDLIAVQQHFEKIIGGVRRIDDISLLAHLE
jgi:hypothetical protein